MKKKKKKKSIYYFSSLEMNFIYFFIFYKKGINFKLFLNKEYQFINIIL